MKAIGLILLSIFLNGFAWTQKASDPYFQGFIEESSGMRFSYHSPLPEVDKSILIRGMQSYEKLQWKTAIVPEDYQQDSVSFMWLYGMDVSSTPSDFYLKLNGKNKFAFSNAKTSFLGTRTFHGENGGVLKLNATLLDKYDDRMGLALLKLPVSAINIGIPNTIEIGTTSDDNAAWYMTFKAPLEEKVSIYQNQVVARKSGQLYHTINLDFFHVGEKSKARIEVQDQIVDIELKTGFNRREIYLPKAELKTTYSARIKVPNMPVQSYSFVVEPVKEWEIFLVQHTHTDIGYTRPQTEILPEHLRYIDHALDFCDQTDGYPDEAKFRWTCETSWSVREYLKNRPETQINRLRKRVEEGRIEVTGMYLNFSEIIDESALVAQSQPIRQFKEKGLEVTTAMQNDVNGIGWAAIDYFKDTGVKYLNMGIHAHRARRPFDKPTAFWWESPAGNRLLAYRSEHYQHANGLGVTSGQEDVLKNNLSKYLLSLEKKNYPYNKVSLQFSGYITDNSPPSVKVCDIIRDWNEKYEWPKLKSALARDFLVFLEEEHSSELEDLSVAWPDWWTDGVGSAANETKEVRKTQTHISTISSLLAMGKLLNLYIPDNVNAQVEEVYDQLLFYDEHTHGAAESITDPLGQNTINQWGMKAAYAWEASKKAYALEERTLAFLESSLAKSNKPTIAIYNTLNWTRSGMVDIFLPHEIVPEGEDFTLTDKNGHHLAYNLVSQRMEGAYFEVWVDNVPAMGYKTIQVNFGQRPNIEMMEGQTMENQYYRIGIDTSSQLITSIYDKTLALELLEKNAAFQLGQVVYEKLANRHELERLTNTNRDTTYRPLKLERSTLQNIKIMGSKSGAIYNSLFLNGQMPGCTDDRGIDIEIRLFHTEKKIELRYRMIKLGETSPEGVYVAFPFHLNQGELAFEVQGGVVYPGKNQLEGSSADWNTIQHFATVRNDQHQIVFVSKETPLVQFGAINTGRYYYRLRPKTNNIYSWVMNNYWVTNFKASQEGAFQWTYNITSAADNSDLIATKFGWSETTPLIGRIMFPDADASLSVLEEKSLLQIENPNVLLVSSKISEDRKGVILHLRSLVGETSEIDLSDLRDMTKASRIEEVNAIEEFINPLGEVLIMEKYAHKFLKLTLDRK